MEHYILDVDGNPIIEPDFMTWVQWFETANRTIARTQIVPGVEVSTVFLGLNHQFSNGPPILYETLVFGGALDDEMDRYHTRKEAEEGHAAMVSRVQKYKG